MKKIYSFIALFLMCFIGTANAQHQWNVVGENIDEIVPGEENFYVIQEGDNTNAEGAAGPHSQSEYLSSLGGTQAEPVHEAIYNFIQVDVKNVDGEEFAVYVLRNVANGKFLVNNDERYTSSKAKAWKFTARKGVAVDEASLTETSTWLEYSNAMSNSRSVNAESMGIL